MEVEGVPCGEGQRRRYRFADRSRSASAPAAAAPAGAAQAHRGHRAAGGQYLKVIGWGEWGQTVAEGDVLLILKP